MGIAAGVSGGLVDMFNVTTPADGALNGTLPVYHSIVVNPNESRPVVLHLANISNARGGFVAAGYGYAYLFHPAALRQNISAYASLGLGYIMSLVMLSDGIPALG